jgi:putative transposase
MGDQLNPPTNPVQIAGRHFWARGYFVSTVERDEVAVRDYIRQQEEEDRRIDPMRLL